MKSVEICSHGFIVSWQDGARVLLKESNGLILDCFLGSGGLVKKVSDSSKEHSTRRTIIIIFNFICGPDVVDQTTWDHTVSFDDCRMGIDFFLKSEHPALHQFGHVPERHPMDIFADVVDPASAKFAI